MCYLILDPFTLYQWCLHHALWRPRLLQSCLSSNLRWARYRKGGWKEGHRPTASHHSTHKPSCHQATAGTLWVYILRITVRRTLKSRKTGRQGERKRKSYYPPWAIRLFIYGLHPHFLLPPPRTLCFIFWELIALFSADFLYTDHHIKSDHLS